MAEMSVIWLRVARTVFARPSCTPFLRRPAPRAPVPRGAGAFALGSVFHFVSIVEEGIVNQRCPITNFYEPFHCAPSSLWRSTWWCTGAYKVASLSVFIFPLVFVMAWWPRWANP